MGVWTWYDTGGVARQRYAALVLIELAAGSGERALGTLETQSKLGQRRHASGTPHQICLATIWGLRKRRCSLGSTIRSRISRAVVPAGTWSPHRRRGRGKGLSRLRWLFGRSSISMRIAWPPPLPTCPPVHMPDQLQGCLNQNYRVESVMRMV